MTSELNSLIPPKSPVRVNFKLAPGLTLNLVLQPEQFLLSSAKAGFLPLWKKDAWERSRITVWDARYTSKSRSALVLFFAKSGQVFLK